MPIYTKADPTRRFLAVLIDNLLATILSFLPVWGGIAAAGYILFRDGFDWPGMRRKSLGKQIMKLNLVRTASDTKPDLQTSIARNWMLALPPLVGMLPFLSPAWMFPLGVAVWLLEGLKVILNPQGLRFGDGWAKTQVIDSHHPGQAPHPEDHLTKKTLLEKQNQRTRLIR